MGVLGAGTMGAGIAQALAQNGYGVLLFDLSDEILSAAEERVRRGLARAEKPEAFSLLRKTTSLSPIASCDAVIEAVVEDLEVKRGLLAQVDPLLGPEKLLATNTSSLSVTELARSTENPERVVGMHFFNPASVMRLVEIVRGKYSSEKFVDTAKSLAESIGKVPVICRDTPGFVANRVARPFYLTGMRLLEEGHGTPDSIDEAARWGGLRMGPLELVDLIGVDVNWKITCTIYESLGRPERLKPREIQGRLVERGFRGRKGAGGFYVYGENPVHTVNPALEELLPGMKRDPWAPERVFNALLEAVIAEARIAVREGVASEEHIDTAMRLGMNWPKGPLEWERKK